MVAEQKIENAHNLSGDKEALVEVKDISKKFARDLKQSLFYGLKDMGTELCGKTVKNELRAGEFWALQNVDFKLKRGEAIGIIGHNGAGKSTLLKIITGLIKPTTGEIHMNGRVQALIELGSGMNPILTGRENIYINAAVMGIPKTVVDEKLDEIIAFSELEEFIDMPLQNYSSGMKVRLGFAIAIHVDPDILIIDEVLAVGDTRFKRKARLEIDRLLKKDIAVIFVSHNLHEVNKITDRCIWLDHGKVQAFDETYKVVSRYISNGHTINQKQDDTLPAFERSMSGQDKPVLEVQAIQSGGQEQRLFEIDKQKQDQIKFEVEYEVTDDFEDQVEFMWQIMSVHDEAYAINVTVSKVSGKAGDVQKRAFTIDLGDIMPGYYKLSLYMQSEKHRKIEHISNVLYISMNNSLSISEIAKPKNLVYKSALGPEQGAMLLKIHEKS